MSIIIISYFFGDKMADIITHTTFALDVVKTINNLKLVENIYKNKDLYFLGAQGPDVFFFHSLLPFNKRSSYKRFGNIMHETKTKAFLFESFNYLKSNYDEKLLSYLLGFLCHHALDRNVHPYIYHVSGFGKKKYRGNHLRIERAIDSYFITKYWDEEKPHRFKIHRLFNFEIDKKVFIPFYNYILLKVYNKNNGGKAFIKSFNNYKRYVKFIYDPMGVKKKIAKFFDKFNNSRLVFEAIFNYQSDFLGIDYLNLNKKTWSHPVLKDEVSCDSFIDLYNKALIEVSEEIKQINLFLNNQITEKKLSLVIKDLSYATGLPCDGENVMTNFNVIL